MLAGALPFYADQRPVSRFPHLLPNPLLQVLIPRRDLLLRYQILRDGLLDDGLGDVHADLLGVNDVRQEAFVRVLESRRLGRERLDGSHEHLVGEELAAAKNGAEADAGKAGRVVALSWRKDSCVSVSF